MATRAQSPDYAHYHGLRASGLTHTHALLTIARKIARRSYHLLHASAPTRSRPPQTNPPCPGSNRPTINDADSSGQLLQLP